MNFPSNQRRRDFSLQLLAMGAGLSAAQAGLAQVPAGLTEDRDFKRLAAPVPVTLPPSKKIDVVEFFSYGCPHCAAFEPVLEAWVRRLPADVQFRPVPFAFFGSPALQKVFYALEAIGQREKLHAKLFEAIHTDKKTLNTDDEVKAFVLAQGVDAGKYDEALNSFGVTNKLSRGKLSANEHKVNSIPMMVVQGRFLTSPGMAGSALRALQIVDLLVDQVRQAR